MFKHIGYKLIDIRKSTGLTQSEVARKSGLNRMTISQIELGKKKLSLDTLIRLLRTYNMLDRLSDLLVIPNKEEIDELFE